MTLARRREEGFGLVELIIYIALTLIILSAVGGVVISMVRVQNQVMNAANSAEEAQLVTRSIGAGVRNATALDLQTVGAGDQIFRMRTATSAANASWFCVAWYYNAADKSLRTKTSPNAIATPNSSELVSWELVSAGITPVQATPVMQLSGTTLRLQFSSQLANEPPIVIRTSVSQGGGVRMSAPCF
jgi:type II secretory pathway pseudopilin PulG